MIFYYILVIVALAEVTIANELARGFNEDIDWYTIDEGMKAIKEQNKPGFLLIHKSWCGACKALKPGFTTNKDIEELSKKYIMINVQDDEEPKDKKYSLDGAYIPRIFFIDARGEIMSDIYNEGGNKNYKFYYPDPKQIFASMKRALEIHEKEEL